MSPATSRFSELLERILERQQTLTIYRTKNDEYSLHVITPDPRHRKPIRRAMATKETIIKVLHAL